MSPVMGGFGTSHMLTGGVGRVFVAPLKSSPAIEIRAVEDPVTIREFRA